MPVLEVQCIDLVQIREKHTEGDDKLSMEL